MMDKPVKDNSTGYRQAYRALRPPQTKFPMVLPKLRKKKRR